MTDTSNGILSTPISHIRVVTGGPEDAHRYADQLADLFESDFFDPSIRKIYLSVFTKERFRRKIVEEYAGLPGFRIITAWAGDELVGFAYGSSLPADSLWWKDVKETLSEEFVEEDGSRTFALFDFVVKNNLRSQGLGSRLHTRLLEGRKEKRVTLLSSEPQQPAYSIWQHWGYQKVGTSEPTKDGTILDVFVRQLAN